MFSWGILLGMPNWSSCLVLDRMAWCCSICGDFLLFSLLGWLLTRLCIRVVQRILVGAGCTWSSLWLRVCQRGWGCSGTLGDTVLELMGVDFVPWRDLHSRFWWFLDSKMAESLALLWIFSGMRWLWGIDFSYQIGVLGGTVVLLIWIHEFGILIWYPWPFALRILREKFL